MICFICAKELELEEMTMNPDGAIEFNFEAAYGSIHDGDKGVIYICDDCFEEREPRVFASYNYIDKEW